LTLSELTDGDQSLSVVQTANWVVDPDHKVGMLSLRLMQTALSQGETAIIIGGTKYTHRVISKIGFKKLLDVERYIKVIKPAQYLAMSRSGRGLLRNAGKLMIFLVNSPLSLFRGNAISASPRRVLRNALNADFLNWYEQCPQGIVHTLKLHDEGTTLIGQATVLIQSRKGNCYAMLLNVDAETNSPSVWSDIVRAAERFLKDKGVTHINTLATFEPFRQALKENGYCRLNHLPLWVRDKNNRLSGVEEWHVTAIEGDLGYLFE
jgi:hypothetical protein